MDLYVPKPTGSVTDGLLARLSNWLLSVDFFFSIWGFYDIGAGVLTLAVTSAAEA